MLTWTECDRKTMPRDHPTVAGGGHSNGRHRGHGAKRKQQPSKGPTKKKPPARKLKFNGITGNMANRKWGLIYKKQRLEKFGKINTTKNVWEKGGRGKQRGRSRP